MLCYDCQVELLSTAPGSGFAYHVLWCVVAILLERVLEIATQILVIWLVYLW